MSGHIDYQIDVANSISDAKNLFQSSSEYKLIVLGIDHPKSISLVKEVFLDQDKVVPIIITETPEVIKKAQKEIKSHSLVNYFVVHNDPNDFFKLIDKTVALSSRASQKQAYCKINTKFFRTTDQVFCDVYIKLSEEKYVKVFTRFQNIESEDIHHFERKNIEYFYVRQKDFSIITKKLVQSLEHLGHDSECKDLTIPSQELSIIFPVHLQETVSESINKIGLTAEAVELTTHAISTTLNILEKNQNVFHVLQKTLNNQNYLSEHSFMLSYIACSAVQYTPYGSDEVNLILTIASFFHDIAFEDGKLAKINDCSNKNSAFNFLGIEEQEEIRNHPMVAINHIKQIEGIPKLVSTVIENHHEKYDGTGFPKGLNHLSLPPLCVIFNLCHEVVDLIVNLEPTPQMIIDFIFELKEKYPQGHYPMALEALEKVFSHALAQIEAA